MQDEIKEFIAESNAIEGVKDLVSFQQACYAWEYLMSEKKIDQHVVLKTHKILMLKQALQPDEKGYYRHCEVRIGGRLGLTYKEVPDAVKVWCTQMNLFPNRRGLSIEEKDARSKNLHVAYERIHPFVDGNGRTGRMFMNWWRLRNNLPILIIHEGDEQMEYYQWFK